MRLHDRQAVGLFDSIRGAECPSVSGLQGGGNNVRDAYQVFSYSTVILIAPNRTIINNHIWLKQGIYIARIKST